MAKDVASQYLSLLATGYRVQEFTFIGTGVGESLVIIPYNMRRVYLHIFLSAGIDITHVVYRLPSGLMVQAFPSLGLNTLNMTLHSQVLSMELIDRNLAADIISGFWIEKV